MPARDFQLLAFSLLQQSMTIVWNLLHMFMSQSIADFVTFCALSQIRGINSALKMSVLNRLHSRGVDTFKTATHPRPRERIPPGLTKRPRNIKCTSHNVPLDGYPLLMLGGGGDMYWIWHGWNQKDIIALLLDCFAFNPVPQTTVQLSSPFN